MSAVADWPFLGIELPRSRHTPLQLNRRLALLATPASLTTTLKSAATVTQWASCVGIGHNQSKVRQGIPMKTTRPCSARNIALLTAYRNTLSTILRLHCSETALSSRTFPRTREGATHPRVLACSIGRRSVASSCFALDCAGGPSVRCTELRNRPGVQPYVSSPSTG